MTGQPHSVLGPPVDVRHMFDSERSRLIDALEDLDDASWAAPTPCPGWSVHDIAAHVLGDDIGRLARTRDHFTGPGARTGESLPQFMDRINDEWVVAARRMGPRLLLSTLVWTGEQITELWNGLPHDRVGEVVSWAGPDPAPVWLDAARDFTEYWVHRQQVHEALAQDAANDPVTLHTVIDTFMRALPHTLRDHERPVGTTFSFVVSGTAGGSWTVERHIEGWRLTDQDTSPNAVMLDVERTWKLCVRMIQPRAAEEYAEVKGDHDLGSAALSMVSIIRSD